MEAIVADEELTGDELINIFNSDDLRVSVSKEYDEILIYADHSSEPVAAFELSTGEPK